MTITSSDTILVFYTSQTNDITTTPQTCPFSNGVFKLWGNWNGASVTISTSVPGNANYFVSITDDNGNPLTFTQDTQFTLSNIVYGDNIVVVLSSVGGSTSLNATLQRV